MSAVYSCAATTWDRPSPCKLVFLNVSSSWVSQAMRWSREEEGRREAGGKKEDNKRTLNFK